MTEVVLNGSPRSLPSGSTVLAAVEAAGGPPDGRGIAVAIDGEVVGRGEWASTELAEGQRVEVLQAVQGG